MTELQSPSDVLSDSPAALIRGMDGLIAYWSSAMEDRYGFTAEQAVGRVSHQLLRTSSWQEIGEIAAVLTDRSVWDGGLIHRRADGQSVLAANHWHLHRRTNDQDMLVTELHSDIVAAGTDAGRQLADVMTTIAQELSQPLTALGSYISGVRRGLEPAWSDKLRLEQGMTEAAAQLARTSEALNRLRSLGENLRDPRLRDSHARLTAAFTRTERIVQASREVTRESKTVLTATVLARQEREKDVRPRRSSTGTGAAPAQRAVALQNIRLFQRLLQQDASDNLDTRAERTLKQLLDQENAKLAALDRQEGG
jgi:PAS domain-containing protein